MLLNTEQKLDWKNWKQKIMWTVDNPVIMSQLNTTQLIPEDLQWRSFKVTHIQIKLVYNQ